MKRKKTKIGVMAVIILALELSGCGTADTPIETQTQTELSQEKQVTEEEVKEVEDFNARYERLTADGNGEANVSYYKHMMEDSTAVVSIAYFGSMYQYTDPWEYITAMEMNEEFQFVEKIDADHIADTGTGSNELFLVIPRDDDAKIRIYTCEIVEGEEEYTEGKGELLLEIEDGKPILVKGSPSEVIGSFVMTLISSDGTEIEYAPFLSGENGELITSMDVISKTDYEPIIWDSTWYEGLTYGYENLFIDSDFTWADFSYQRWYGMMVDADGKSYSYDLLLDQSGKADFTYSDTDTGLTIAILEGTWEKFTKEQIGNKAINPMDMMINLHLTCTSNFTDDDVALSIDGVYGIEMWVQDVGFSLIPLYGPYLIPELEETADPYGMSFWEENDAG